MEKPRLRPVEVVPVVHNNQQFFRMFDPSGVGEGLLVSPGALRIAVHFFNGKNTVRDIQAEILKKGGSLVPSGDIECLIEALDEAGLLDSERFRQRLEACRAEYDSKEFRPAVHAGSAYPKDPQQLAASLKGVLEEARSKGASRVDGLRALLSPHIDLARGWLAYGFAYAALEGAAPGRVIVLGTGHHVGRHAFVLTEKDFLTPLGTVRTDRHTVDRLARACGREALEDQFEHLHEHSIEFQLLFLRHLFGDSFTVVPILCGSFPPPEPGGTLPREEDVIRRFCEELRAIIAESPGDTLVVAGADFAHVGPRFGGEHPVDEALLTAVEVSDRALLAALCQGDPDLFYRRLGTNRNQYAVCGYSAMYTLLCTLPDLRGQVLRYEQAVHPDASQAVTFSAVAFT